MKRDRGTILETFSPSLFIEGQGHVSGQPILLELNLVFARFEKGPGLTNCTNDRAGESCNIHQIAVSVVCWFRFYGSSPLLLCNGIDKWWAYPRRKWEVLASFGHQEFILMTVYAKLLSLFSWIFSDKISWAGCRLPIEPVWSAGPILKAMVRVW